jgi:N,N'-diacetyllegionaminate synthase
MSDSTGHADHCEVIAEVGVNHNGEVGLARELVDEAVAAGADTVKFQTFVPDRIVTEATEKATYQKRSDSDSQYEMLQRVVLSEAEHEELFEYCESRGIEFLSTPYDPGSVDVLDSLGVSRYKIASADIVNKPLLDAVAESGKPVILSTGMATLGEIERAVQFLRDSGCPDITLLHCVSCYPTDPEQVNMRFMDTLDTAFDVPVGFSDHTLGTDVPVMAAARGATTVEKHVTLDREMDGPDHFASLEPQELDRMIDGIRTVESALGTTELSRTAREMENVDQMRRSIHFATDIQPGDVLTRDDVKIVRPNEGISPWQMDEVVGRTVTSDVSENDPATWSVFES